MPGGFSAASYPPERRRLLQCNWCARVPLATDEILRQQLKLSEHICVLNRDLSEFPAEFRFSDHREFSQAFN